MGYSFVLKWETYACDETLQNEHANQLCTVKAILISGRTASAHVTLTRQQGAIAYTGNPRAMSSTTSRERTTSMINGSSTEHQQIMLRHCVKVNLSENNRRVTMKPKHSLSLMALTCCVELIVGCFSKTSKLVALVATRCNVFLIVYCLRCTKKKIWVSVETVVFAVKRVDR